MELSGKVALVTGGGTGIGRAAAVRLAKAGAKVAVLARTESDLETTVKQIEAAGSDGLVVVADVSKADQMKRAVEQTIERFGRLDIVVANAGINGVWAPIEEIEPDEWDQTVAVNLRGTYLAVHFAAPELKKHGGAIVVTASVNGTRIFSNAGATAYATTKAGQVAFAKMLAVELAKFKVRVNVVCPGAITTEIEESVEKRDVDEIAVPVEYPEGKIPLTGGKPGKAEQVADLIHFLVSDASSHITGTEVWIDGAESLVQG